MAKRTWNKEGEMSYEDGINIQPKDYKMEQNDIKYKRLMNVIYGLIITILGAGILQFISFGEVKAQVGTNAKLLQFISSDYTPTWYMTGMTELFAIHTEQIGAIIQGNESQIKKLNEDFQKTIKIMQDNFIRMRGGVTDATRSIKKSP